MAANLTPQYYKAENAFRRAQTSEERIVALREMLRVIPKHKGTDHLQGALRARLKEVRDAHLAELKSPSTGRSYRVPRQGCGTVVVVGAPNSGKSRLVAELTNATPEVAEFPFTTREPCAGMMTFDGVLIQLIDTPPISGSDLEPYVVDFVRTADLVLCCVDGSSDDAVQQTVDVVQQLASRKTVLDEVSGFGPRDYSVVHVKSRLVVTRGNAEEVAVRQQLLNEILTVEIPMLTVDLDNMKSRESLAGEIFAALGMIRIYTKRPGEAAEQVDPYAIPIGGTVEDLAQQVHEEIANRFRFARIWGQSSHAGQIVGREHVLNDKDTVELHM